MARKLLKTNDSAWLFAETHRTPMQVGMLATFRVPEDRPTFVADLVANWRECREYAPPFNLLYKTLPVPSWVELEAGAIDLDYHLRHSALPAPGSQRELGILVSRLHSQKMDRRYPLWECHVIEGLEEDRWSLYLKAHHSQVDGVGGIRLLRRILSADPDARGMLPPWAIGTRGPDQSGIPAPAKVPAPEIARSGPIELVRDGARSTAAVAGSLGSHLRRERDRSRGRGRPGRPLPGTEDDLQRPDPHTPALRDAALLDRADEAGREGGRRQPQRRVPGDLWWRDAALPDRARRTPDRGPDRERAGVGAAGSRRQGRQRGDVPVLPAGHRRGRPGRTDPGHQDVDQARQGAVARGGQRRHGCLHGRR